MGQNEHDEEIDDRNDADWSQAEAEEQSQLEQHWLARDIGYLEFLKHYANH